MSIATMSSSAHTTSSRDTAMPSENLTLQGHIIDSLTLPKVLDEIIELGAVFEIVDLQIGIKHEDPSFARIKVTTGSEDELTRLIDRLRHHGANPETVEDATLLEADMDGALP